MITRTRKIIKSPEVEKLPEIIEPEVEEAPVINEPVVELPKWRKVGRGCLIIGERLIKPNQVFTAAANEIPESFKDIIIPAGGVVPKALIANRPATGLKIVDRPAPKEDYKNSHSNSTPDNTLQSQDFMYTLKVNEENAGLWDIVDKNGKQLNAFPMSYVDATNLLSVL
jgi:hypothetical protein